MHRLFLAGFNPPLYVMPIDAGKTQRVYQLRRLNGSPELIRYDVAEAVQFTSPPFSMEWYSRPVRLDP